MNNVANGQSLTDLSSREWLHFWWNNYADISKQNILLYQILLITPSKVFPFISTM